MNSKAYSLRGYSYLMINQLIKSLSDYNKAIKLNPSFSNYLERSIVYRRFGEFENYIKDLNKAKSLYSSKLNHSFQFGSFYLGQRQYKKALDYFEKAINEDNIDSSTPILHSIYAKIGKCNYKLGNYNTALKNYILAEKIYSKSTCFYTDFGLNYEALGLPEKAIKSYSRAINLDQKYLIPRYNRANNYFNNKNYGKAIIDYKIAETLTDRLDLKVIINCNLSRLSFLKKDYIKSIHYGRKALKGKSISLPDKFFCIAKSNMAISYLKLSEPKTAYSLYSECFTNNGIKGNLEIIKEIRDDLIAHYKLGLDQPIVKKILLDFVKVSNNELENILLKKN